MLVMGGEAYVFKPRLIDADDAITDDGTRKFLHSFVDPSGHTSTGLLIRSGRRLDRARHAARLEASDAPDCALQNPGLPAQYRNAAPPFRRHARRTTS